MRVSLWRRFVALLSWTLFPACASIDAEFALRSDLVRIGFPQEGDWSEYKTREEYFTTLQRRIPRQDDATLRSVFDSFMRRRPAFGNAAKGTLWDAALREMIRRGGREWEEYLAEKLDDLEPVHGDRLRNLELLTALRRVQKRPDPIRIVVRASDDLEATFPEMPVLEVALTHADSLGREVEIQSGGDHGGGRQERWRFEVQDAQGRILPVREIRGYMVGGGVTGSRNLRPGDSWETDLDMGKFIPPLEPGEYTFKVQYHDQFCIAPLQDISGLIVCESKPFKLTIEPRTIRLTQGDRKASEGLIERLEDRRQIKVLACGYSGESENFIEPLSPEGMLLSKGWQSVPFLFEALLQESLTPHRRAWIFALLFSITGQRDPRYDEDMRGSDRGLLGDFDTSEVPWRLSFRSKGNRLNWGMGFSLPRTVCGTICLEEQLAFEREWIAWGERFVQVDR